MKSPFLTATFARVTAILTVAGSVITPSACSSGERGRPGCAIDGSSIDTTAQLSKYTDFLVSAIVTAKSASNKGDGCGLQKWTSDLRITAVHAQRPGASLQLTPGRSIVMKTWLLDSRSGVDVSSPGFADERDAPHLGDHIIAFLYDANPSSGAGLEAGGYAILLGDGQATTRAIAGGLNHQTLPVTALTTDLVGEVLAPR